MGNKKYGKRLRLSPGEVDLIESRRNNGYSNMPSSVGRLPKILVFDIETAPLSALIWQLKTMYVNTGMLEKSENWWNLSWAAKWLYDEDVMSDVVTPEEALNEDDSRINESLWKLMDEADVIISHNGKKYDHRRMNARWLLQGMNPPSPYRIIDTLAVSRRMFALPSYKLDYIAKALGVGHKLPHAGISMWKKCLLGDAEALKSMDRYCKHDVTILEDTYFILRPWIPSHPNFGLYMESEVPVCAACGGNDLEPVGEYRTNVSTFKTLRCYACGSLSRQRKNALPKSVRKALVTSI